jgi:hypothetical protein
MMIEEPRGNKIIKKAIYIVKEKTLYKIERFKE